MKLNYPLRFLVICLAGFLAAWFWKTDGVSRGLDLRGGASLTYSLNLSQLPPRAREDALLNTVSIIEERVNNLGLKDVKVDALPPDQFEVQFPGKESREVERIKKILTRLGNLEFRIIAMPPGEEVRLGSPGVETTERKRRREMGKSYPGPRRGYRWVPLMTPTVDSEGNPIRDRLVEIPEADAEAEVERLTRLLEEVKGDPAKEAEVNRQLEKAREELRRKLRSDVFGGKDLDPGELFIHPSNTGPGWEVAFAMRDERRANFGDFTKRNLKRRMAIILDGKMESAPIIQSALTGTSRITGGGWKGFTKQEAQDLVTILRSGSLEVEITLQSEFAIGPSLGEASIRRGLLATGIGFAAVVGFMLLAYLFPGLVAVFALLMNLVIIMGALAFFQAQLSLPGIAGVILTVGMAVDANILVFERIREERQLGKSLISAVKAGYDRAFITIVDANVTTLFAAFVLYAITSGQVRGFAITLVFGILASMFTALYVTKAIFGWMIDHGLLKEMRMPRLMLTPHLKYMRIRLPMILLSLVLVIAGVVAFDAVDQEDKFDIEFLGGQRVVLSFKDKASISDVKRRIMRTYPDATVITIKSDRPTAAALDLSTESDAFQVTVAGANTERKRAEVLAFLAGEFKDELSPEGVVPLTGGQDPPPGTEQELRLSFEEEVGRDVLQKMLASIESVSDPRILSLEGKTAVIKVRLDRGEEKFREDLDRAVRAADVKLSEPFPMKRFVDPHTAQQHRDDAIEAVLISLVFQIIYIYFRFHGASFGFAAVIALLHDVLITLGAITLFGWLGLVNVKINLPNIAAILTLIGYSMNDTIVVFDRIRENLRHGRRNLSEVIDLSVNQTMSRTLRTSVTTFLVVLVLFIVNYGAASSVLEGFSFVLMVGVITGTYSSIFIASPMLLFLPWHYLRGRSGIFWVLVTVTLVGFVIQLFAPTGWFHYLTIAATIAYPAYFLVDLVRWLLIPEPDRALNIVLRSSRARV